MKTKIELGDVETGFWAERKGAWWSVFDNYEIVGKNLKMAEAIHLFNTLRKEKEAAN